MGVTVIAGVGVGEASSPGAVSEVAVPDPRHLTTSLRLPTSTLGCSTTSSTAEGELTLRLPPPHFCMSVDSLFMSSRVT